MTELGNNKRSQMNSDKRLVEMILVYPFFSFLPKIPSHSRIECGADSNPEPDSVQG